MSGVRYGKVAVLMGGVSRERNISLRSGEAVLEALVAEGIEARPVDPARGFYEQMRGAGFDRAFIALHGRGGEDGSIQGALEYLGIPYTGSGVLGAALSMDKICSKQVWRGVGLATPDFLPLRPDSRGKEVEQKLGWPVMVKPAQEGSSLGMSKVERLEEFAAAAELALAHDQRAFAERWVEGREYTVSIINDTPLPVIRLETPRQFYDYAAKYEATDTGYHCPCGLPADAELRMQELALSAFRTLDCQGWGRVDLMLDRQECPWLVEVNSVPGLTDHSLVPMAARGHGWSFAQLVLRILDSSFVSRPVVGSPLQEQPRV